MMAYGFGAMSFLGPLMMVLFWGGLILLAVWAIRAFAAPRPAHGDEPLAILRRRLAAGEITQAEYEQARRVLQG